MSTFYALYVKPNWAASFGPTLRDMTETLDLGALPSIQIAAERSEVPLVASVSDLSLTVSNAAREWDAIFDATKIIGQLPPIAGEIVRAPAAHLGSVALYRLADEGPLWQLVFFGFIDAASPRFDRQARTCTFTAYAPGKMLEAGNAERVNRFHAMVPSGLARPFVVPVDAGTGRGAVQHPALAGGVATIKQTTITATLNGAIASGVTALVVHSAVGFPAPTFVVQIDSEYIQVITEVATVTWSVIVRGVLGSTAASHSDNAIVTLMTTGVDDSWWKLVGGNSVTVVPLLAGDQFQVVRAIEASGWAEGMATVQIVNKQLTIAQVSSVGADIFFQTTEVITDPVLVLTGFTAGIEILNPWYQSRDWKALIDGSDGNSNCLQSEVNAALALLDVLDTLAFSIPGPPALPLLPATKQLFAQPIYQPDCVPGCSGVSYALWTGAVPTLFHQRYTSIGTSPVTGKPDILAADEAGTAASTNLYSTAGGGGYLLGPDDGLPVRLLSSSVNDQLTATPPPDYSANDIPVAGQDLHVFVSDNDKIVRRYDSTHWVRAPSSYRSGSEPKRYYRIFAKGFHVGGSDHYKKGIEITEVTTGDTGATWTIVSNSENYTASSYPSDVTAAPNSSRSSRPSIKVFELDATHFLYAWVDPFLQEAYSYESATDDVVAGTLLSGFGAIFPGGDVNSPILSSSFVHWPGTTLFFCDRADGTGVDVYYYAPGPTWTLATIVDNSGLGIPVALLGADWINAVADSSRSPVRLYVMVGSILYAMQVAFSAGTLTISEAQAVPIDQINYDPNIEATSPTASNPNAVAWLTCPVTQAFAGEPDYSAASDALIVGTKNAVYILSNVAVNLVDVADFTGLSVAAALSKMIQLRAYFMLTAADQDFVPDPALYTPTSLVTFYARLETALRKGVLDLTDLTEATDSGIWLQTFTSVLVGNSKRNVGPAISATTLTNLDGASFTINPPRNAKSVALNVDNPFLTTRSFAQLLANLYGQEFVIPRPAANVTIRDPGVTLLPGRLVRYLLAPPDAFNDAIEAQGRTLTIDYALANHLMVLGVA